jgi:hypothetical protein
MYNMLLLRKPGQLSQYQRRTSAGLLPPLPDKTLQNRKLKNTDFVDVMISKARCEGTLVFMNQTACSVTTTAL